MNPVKHSAIAAAFAMSLMAIAVLSPSHMAYAGQPPPSHTGEVSSVQDDAAGGTVSQLRELMDHDQLTELRTTYNGTYGASLLFQADKLTYFVALFHEKAFWRVIRTDSQKDAENAYRSFVAQTEKLAQVNIDALRLQAGKNYAQHMVALNKQRLQALRQDATRRQQQAQRIAAAQEQARQQAVSLSSDLRATSHQLDAVQQNIRQLETQQDNPEMSLSAPASTDDSADGASSIEPGSPIAESPKRDASKRPD